MFLAVTEFGFSRPPQPDWQLSDANACRMIDCVGNGRSSAHIAQLSNAFYPDRIDEIVLLRNKDHVDVLNIRVHRNEIVRKTVIDVARPAAVDLGCFM